MRVKYNRKNEYTDTYEFRKQQIENAEADLAAYGNKEVLALFRIMKETGIRLGDLVELAPGNLNGKELTVIEHKLNRIYAYSDGTKPVISEETADLLVLKDNGRYFEHGTHYYIQMFQRVVKDKGFRYYQIRDYALKSRKFV